MSRRDDIVAAAGTILAAEGPEALTMRRLGDAVGMRAPSLYKHVECRDDVLAALQLDAMVEAGRMLAAADLPGAPRRDRIRAMAAAYRRWALDNPHRYELVTRRPLPRDRFPEGAEARAEAPVLAVAGDRDTARALWAVAHGLVDLELAGRFPPGADIDAAWDAAVDAIAAHAERTAARADGGPGVSR